MRPALVAAWWILVCFTTAGCEWRGQREKVETARRSPPLTQLFVCAIATSLVSSNGENSRLVTLGNPNRPLLHTTVGSL